MPDNVREQLSFTFLLEETLLVGEPDRVKRIKPLGWEGTGQERGAFILLGYNLPCLYSQGHT
jgi:hypothetical protein